MQLYRSNGPSRARKKGAVAVLVRSSGSGSFRLAHTGLTKYEDSASKIPAGAISAEDADLISDLAEQGPAESKRSSNPPIQAGKTVLKCGYGSAGFCLPVEAFCPSKG